MNRKFIFTILVILGFTIILLSFPIFFPLEIVKNSQFFEKYSNNSDNVTLLLRQIEERNYSITIKYRNDFPATIAFANRHPPLKETIKKESPNIDDPTIDNWTKVRILRNWANNNINYAFNRELTLDSQEKNHYYQKNASEIFILFHNEKGGVMCGGTAYALQQLYELYGFEAYTVNMGIIGNFTHVVTLVNISDNNQSLLSIQDAYTDISYTKLNDQPLDYFEMLNLLKNHQDQLIKIERGPNQGRTFFWGKNQNTPNKTILLEGLMYCNNINFTYPVIISNDYIEFRGKLTYESIDLCNRYRYVEFLDEDGYPTSQIYIFMYPFSIISNSGPNDDFLKQAQKIISNNSSVIS
jgi:hypothetical protein